MIYSFVVLEALMKYRSKNEKLPTCLVVYRDGVGDGQISYVHKIEVKLLKVIIFYIALLLYINIIIITIWNIFFFQTACEQFYGPSSVPLAFIIVTKRINTRFFASSHNGPKNPQPGTVIDNVVTDPTK